jgi:hypothetical protein
MYWRTVFDGPFGLDATTFRTSTRSTCEPGHPGKPSLQLAELGRDGGEFVELPRGAVVVVDQAEQRLLLAAVVAVPGPGQHRLGAQQQTEMGPHARAALGPVVAGAAGRELVEPDRRVHAGAHHGRLEAGAERVARVEAHA